jgi:hypothetical protein
MGVRVTRYLHGRRTRLDRWLLGNALVVPATDGARLGWSTTF